MSLYNMLFGFNPFAAFWLEVLCVKLEDIPRFRDCYLNEAGEIEIFTRTGGGNRLDYIEENESLRKVKGFIADADDKMDRTYARFRYSVPERYAGAVKELTEMGAVDDPAKNFQRLLDNLDKNDTSDPAVVRALEIGKEIFAKFEEDPKPK